MNWIELIQLRTYSRGDKDEAVSAFQQLSLPNGENGLMDIRLLKNHTLPSDLIICMNWRADIPVAGKSPLGLEVAAAFSQFGGVHHAIWTTKGKFDVNRRRQTP